jgi:uncharacterized protein YmfQ (DUF2313 family)
VIEGKQFDSAQESAENLLTEMFPDAAVDSITDWERTCGIVPDPDSPLQYRRTAVLKKLRELGGVSRQYFIDLAASFGWTITIDEFLPFMCGWNQAGERLFISDVYWCWRVNAPGTPIYEFRSGQSCAGEKLTWWPANTALEALITELKPAHTAVIFSYEVPREAEWEEGVEWAELPG